MRERIGLSGEISSFRPGLLQGSNLDNGRGIFVGLGLVGGVTLGEARSLVSKCGVLELEPMGSSIALGIGVGVGFVISFFRKRRFLSVILPDPSTPARYCRCGRTSMMVPVVVHRRFDGFWMATLSPFCSRPKLCVCLLYLSDSRTFR